MTRLFILVVTSLQVMVAACATSPSASTDRADWFCPAKTIPPFPQPVPKPSFIAGINRDHLPVDASETTLRQVGRRLEAVLLQAGYRSATYLGYGCSGFALVADLERIEPDGTPFAGDLRFGPQRDDSAFDAAEVARRLFFAPPGFYRQIILLVEDDEVGEPTTLATSGDLRERVATGQSSLPYAYDELGFESEYLVRVLIYEFEKGTGDKDVRLHDRTDGPEGPRHLTKANLYDALRGFRPADDE